MSQRHSINEFVVKFANVNGTGSASANLLFAKSLFRMGLSVSPKNIFPSNIQGLPTWYEVRVSGSGYLGRGDQVDLMVAMNAQSLLEDIQELPSGGYLLYDNSKPLAPELIRSDIHLLGLPLTEMCVREYDDMRKRQLFKNIVYVGALAALLKINIEVIEQLLQEQFGKRQDLVDANIQAVELGYHEALKCFDCPLPFHVEECHSSDGKILIDGNTALALGAIYAGATVVAWYPITPSTSVAEAFEKYAKKLRVDAESGEKKYAVVQAEDELAAIGMVIGAGWNGARAFTATSGPGISLMSEFLGLSYFAEVPVVLFNIQRVGPSTGMPTRTQQSDVLSCAYASHGDTRHVLLFPSTPAECFDFSATAFDLAERLQTPIIVLSDLDLGMNDHVSEPLHWQDGRHYDRGKVADKAFLDDEEDFGRYLDVDGDGICYRTYPGTHPEKGAFFTRGSSHDPYAVYTESGEVYAEGMARLLNKWETAKTLVPQPVITPSPRQEKSLGVLYYGSSAVAVEEALDILTDEGLSLSAMRIRAFPFPSSVVEFIASHEYCFVVEQNRDAQMCSLLVNECGIDPAKLLPVTIYDGMPLKSSVIVNEIHQVLPAGTLLVASSA